MALPMVMRTRLGDSLGLFGFLVACFAVAAIGGSVTAGSVGTWYQALHKPSFNPPDWIFGPVWTALYTLMAIAAWRVWRRTGWSNGMEPLSLFGAQLALNLSWSVLFFGSRRIGAAMVCIVALFLGIAATAAAFRKTDRLAAWLMAPYLVWVAFAAVLNFSIWSLN